MNTPNSTPPPHAPNFLMQDAKNNYLAYVANEEQKRNDERYNKLLRDLGLAPETKLERIIRELDEMSNRLS